MALPVNEQALKQIILEGNPEQLDKFATSLGEALAEGGLTTSQIRKIYGTAKTIQAKWAIRNTDEDPSWELVMLKPKLAYQARRHYQVTPLKDWIVAAINIVRDQNSEVPEDKRFMRFMDFFEATLAYHTAAGGKQN